METVTRLAVVAALALLAGCTITPGPAPDPAGMAGPVAAASASPTPAASATASVLPALASRKTSSDGNELEVAVNSVTVKGGATTLNFTVTNRGHDRWRPWTSMDTGLELTVSGVYLVDHDNGKRHLPARDADGDCVCSRTHQQIGPNQSVTYSAVFAPLPEGVAAASVHVPTAGTFDDVPVTR